MKQQGTASKSKKPNIVWFDDSPDCGPDCICSLCKKPIYEEEGPALRFHNGRDKKEARFHLKCANTLRLVGSL